MVIQELKHSLVSRQRKANGRDVRDVWKFFPEHGHGRCCCNKPNTNAVAFEFFNIKRQTLGGILFNQVPSQDALNAKDTLKVKTTPRSQKIHSGSRI